MLRKGNMLVKDIYFNQIKQKKGIGWTVPPKKFRN